LATLTAAAPALDELPDVLLPDVLLVEVLDEDDAAGAVGVLVDPHPAREAATRAAPTMLVTRSLFMSAPGGSAGWFVGARVAPEGKTPARRKPFS
jgi:hypothetical protein